MDRRPFDTKATGGNGLEWAWDEPSSRSPRCSCTPNRASIRTDADHCGNACHTTYFSTCATVRMSFNHSITLQKILGETTIAGTEKLGAVTWHWPGR